jgi:alanine racemase
VLRVHHVKGGREVGYSAAYRTPNARRLAQIGVGYGQGVPFSFSKPACVLISGFKAQIVATSAMSLLSVDVTDLPEDAVQAGMRAILFGPELPVDQLAHAAGVAPNVVHVHAGLATQRFHLAADDALATMALPRQECRVAG